MGYVQVGVVASANSGARFTVDCIDNVDGDKHCHHVSCTYRLCCCPVLSKEIILVSRSSCVLQLWPVVGCTGCASCSVCLMSGTACTGCASGSVCLMSGMACRILAKVHVSLLASFSGQLSPFAMNSTLEAFLCCTTFRRILPSTHKHTQTLTDIHSHNQA